MKTIFIKLDADSIDTIRRIKLIKKLYKPSMKINYLQFYNMIMVMSNKELIHAETSNSILKLI